MHLLAKDAPFVFTEECLQSFHTLEKALISAPVIQPPAWHLPFEILRKQGSDWTPTELCHNGKGSSCRGICHRKVYIIFGGRQGHCVYRSCRSQVSLDKETCKTTPDLMETSTPRI
jgi:hypothetical protein